jgi:hypothetical protein
MGTDSVEHAVNIGLGKAEREPLPLENGLVFKRECDREVGPPFDAS